MGTGPVACALVGLLVLACGRTDLSASLVGASDAGTQTAPSSSRDADAVQDAGDVVDEGADSSDGATCSIPGRARSSDPDGTAGCTPVFNWTSSLWCTSSQYELACHGTTMTAVPESSLGCVEEPATDTLGDTYYCCPCVGSDAGTGCVNVDLSTYDRSCSSDSDCIAITSGVICPGNWLCSNATVNADGQRRYEQTIALLPPVGPNFHCRRGPPPVCVRGVCTVEPDNQ